MNALPVLASAVGGFFALSGYHKLTNPARHAALRATLEADGVPFVRFNQWWVPACEFVAGTTLTLAPLTLAGKIAAIVLLVICAVACAVDGRKRVEEWKPLDVGDRLDDWLYLPEVLYAMILVAAVLA